MTMRHAISPASLLVGYLKKGKEVVDKKTKQPTGKLTNHCTDGDGMFILVDPATTSGTWWYEYLSPVSGKRTKHRLGECKLGTDGKTVVGVGVAAARIAHQEAISQVAAGLDPNVEKEKEKAQTIATAAADKANAKAIAAFNAENRRRVKMGLPTLAMKDSFRHCAEQWIDSQRGRLKPSYLYELELSLKNYAYPLFADKHINDVDVDDIAKLDDSVLLQPGLAKKPYHALIKVRRVVRHVCDWAISPKRKLRTNANPVFKDPEMWDHIPKAKSHAAAITEDAVRDLMLSVMAPVPAQAEWDLHGGRHATPTVVCALRLIAMTGQRSHNIQQAAKVDFHLDADLPHWVIPAAARKGRLVELNKGETDDHVVFLSRQAVTMLREQFAAHPDSPWVFPGQFKGKGSHMGSTAMWDRLNVLGFKGKHTPHGFRPMMRTAGQKFAGISGVVLEEMLSHKDAKEGLALSAAVQRMLNGGMPGVYDRTEELEQAEMARKCAEAAQAWSDWLEKVTKPRLALVA